MKRYSLLSIHIDGSIREIYSSDDHVDVLSIAEARYDHERCEGETRIVENLLGVFNKAELMEVVFKGGKKF